MYLKKVPHIPQPYVYIGMNRCFDGERLEPNTTGRFKPQQDQAFGLVKRRSLLLFQPPRVVEL
jgi:hypothetical protein